MRFEEAIKTSKFQSEIQKAHLHILFTAGWVRARIGNRLKPFGITSEQYNVLRILRGQATDSVRVMDISERMLERNSNTTRLIDRLIDKGLVNRLKATHDGRERAIQLTTEGSSLLQQIDKAWENGSPHSSLLTQEEAAMLNHLLDRLRECDEEESAVI
ncbi:MAG: MarR family transcriptional regulator [Saprospiraceae bacterium]|nr:MarR family transcriptional regulator [Saprospiraceae bacterium]